MVDLKKVKVEVSNRHVHLSKEHIEILFGEEYELNKHRELSQVGEFSAHEKVTLINGEMEIKEVRVLGPPRRETQIEVSKTDALHLRLNPPVKHSGDLEGSPGLVIVGPKGKVELDKGVIISHRHIHVSEEEAETLELKNGQIVKVKISHEEDFIFEDVAVRVHPNYRLAFHIDKDESKCLPFERGLFCEIIK